jgi:hypothetical protein
MESLDCAFVEPHREEILSLFVKLCLHHEKLYCTGRRTTNGITLREEERLVKVVDGGKEVRAILVRRSIYAWMRIIVTLKRAAHTVPSIAL